MPVLHNYSQWLNFVKNYSCNISCYMINKEVMYILHLLNTVAELIYSAVVSVIPNSLPPGL